MRVVIPDQLTMIATPVSPLAAEADRQAVAWAEQYRLVTTPAEWGRLVATKPGTLAAHCYPSGSQDGLFLLADWMTWLFSLDLRVTTLDCVGMLRAWMRGHVEWGRNTARYLEAMS